MATAATEIKPDFGAPKRHFCFTDEHEALRESIESFATQGARAALRRVGAGRLPGLGLQAHGRARLPRHLLPGGVRRPGRRLPDVDRARRGDGAGQQRRARDGHRRPHRHGDAADPEVRLRGPEADLPRAGDQGREDLVASASRSRAPAPTWPASAPAPCATATSTSSTARRRSSPTARAPTSSCSSRRPTPTPATTASRCSWSTPTRRASTCRASSRSSGCTPPTPRS